MVVGNRIIIESNSQLYFSYRQLFLKLDCFLMFYPAMLALKCFFLDVNLAL